MADPTPCYFEFGPFRADPMRRVLLRDGEPVSITAKVFDTLLLLIENQGNLLTKDELLKRLWPDRIVEEAGLTQNIAVLRKILGESPGENQYIVTVPGRGYRFVSPVRVQPIAGPREPPADLSAAGIRPARRTAELVAGVLAGLAAGIVLALWLRSPTAPNLPLIRFAFTPGGGDSQLLDNLDRCIAVGYDQHGLAGVVGQNPRNDPINAVRVDWGDVCAMNFRDSPGRLLRA